MQIYATRTEAAELLRVAVSQLDKWTKLGRIKSIKLGRRKTLFRIADLQEFVERAAKENDRASA